MNCGRNAKKNIATLGLSTFVIAPRRKMLARLSRFNSCEDSSVFCASILIPK